MPTLETNSPRPQWKRYVSYALTVEALVLGTLITTACGSAPTAPTISTRNVTAAPPPSTDPPPTPPTTPTPGPAPTPAPAPAPTPAPAPAPTPQSNVYIGTVESVRWYGAPLFGETFTIVKHADRVAIGSSLVLPLVSSDAAGWFAASRDATFTVREGRWTLASVYGDGVGTIK